MNSNTDIVEVRSDILRIAGRLIRIQFDSPEDLDLPKTFGRARYRKLYKRIEDHNETLKRLAMDLKIVYEKFAPILNQGKEDERVK